MTSGPSPFLSSPLPSPLSPPLSPQTNNDDDEITVAAPVGQMEPNDKKFLTYVIPTTCKGKYIYT